MTRSTGSGRDVVGTWRKVVLFLLVAGLSACGTRPDPERSGPRVREPIEVRIENQNYLDMVVSVESGGQRVRLGLVVGGNSQESRIPDSMYMVGPIQMVAEPIGPRGEYRSEAVMLSPGDRVVFRIGTQLGLSTVILR